MKLFFLLPALLLTHTTLFSQTVAEWTQQNKTQLRYLAKQIAATQVYIGHIKKGYAIARDGLRFIGDIRDGEFQLHRNYFASLGSVSPAIQQFARHVEMISLVIRVYDTYRRHIRHLRASGRFSETEILEAGQLFQRLIREMETLLDRLLVLLTPGAYVMKDAERRSRIAEVQASLSTVGRQAQQLASSNLLLAVQRLQSQQEVDLLRKLYNLK